MPLAICYKCRWFINLEPDSPRADIWYNHVCAKSPLPTRTNPTTGNLEHYITNDLGMIVSTRNRYQYCRNVNPTGECSNIIPVIELVVVGE